MFKKIRDVDDTTYVKVTVIAVIAIASVRSAAYLINAIKR